jgi:hypothetical protein
LRFLCPADILCITVIAGNTFVNEAFLFQNAVLPKDFGWDAEAESKDAGLPSKDAEVRFADVEAQSRDEGVFF